MHDLSFEIPTEPPKEWTPTNVIRFVKTGMVVELSTIPLYLYAMYSIKPEKEGGIQARAEIRGIVQQEMLHLALTGNLLSSLGGSLNLYDYKNIPRYPDDILISKVRMDLTGANKRNLERFLRIEAADNPRPSFDNKEPGILMDPMIDVEQYDVEISSVIPGYDSIGNFYADLLDGLRKLSDGCFKNNADKQFSDMDFFGDQLVIIKDKASALKAMNIVVEQGEGNGVVDNSHYNVFTNLYHRKALDLHNMPENPKTSDYKETSPYIYALSCAFDASYCYLLQTIQRVWKTGSEDKILLRMLLLRNTQAIMTKVLTPLSNLMIQERWGTGCAAPCFNYYPMEADGVTPLAPLDPETLHMSIIEALSAALGAFGSNKVLSQMKTYIENEIPPFPNSIQ